MHRHALGYAALLAVVYTAGCAVVKPRAALVISRNCITDVHLTDDTRCVYNEKTKQWRCLPLVIDKYKGCEHVEVLHDPKP